LAIQPTRRLLGRAVALR